jgi:hypothetical protein
MPNQMFEFFHDKGQRETILYTNINPKLCMDDSVPYVDQTVYTVADNFP